MRKVEDASDKAICSVFKTPKEKEIKSDLFSKNDDIITGK